MSGRFVTFEGIDFCGKSVQIEKLIERLEKKRIPHILLREPGGTSISERIRETLLMNHKEDMSPITEFLLFNAARAQLVKQRVRPALQQNKLVICDRYYDSSTAYQGYGRNIDLKNIRLVNQFATQGLKPDLTFLIDIDLEEMERRKRALNQALDRMEDQTRHFFEQARNGFLEIAQSEPERFCVINGKKEIYQISDEIWQQLATRFPDLIN